MLSDDEKLFRRIGLRLLRKLLRRVHGAPCGIGGGEHNSVELARALSGAFAPLPLELELFAALGKRRSWGRVGGGGGSGDGTVSKTKQSVDEKASDAKAPPKTSGQQ